MSAWHRAAADLFLGVACAGCHLPGVTLCDWCRSEISPHPRPVELRTAPRDDCSPLIFAAGAYSGILRNVLVSWKEQGRHSLSRALAHLLAAAVVTAHQAGPGQFALLVPVPCSWRSRRTRGTDIIADLARAAVTILRSVGVRAQVLDALRYARRTRDQAGLDAEERHRNLSGAYRLKRSNGLLEQLAQAPVIVVDDIVTTGSTTAEAVRVLNNSDCKIAAIAVIAATPPPGARR